jgi:hypothetical protein
VPRLGVRIRWLVRRKVLAPLLLPFTILDTILTGCAIATATFAVAQALATVSSVNSQASLSIQGARVEAISMTRFALVVTFSILGSSIISILAFYFIVRLRRRGREKREERKMMISYPQVRPVHFPLADDPQRNKANSSTSSISKKKNGVAVSVEVQTIPRRC